MNDIQLTQEKDIVYSSFTLHKNGLTAIGTPTYEQWEEVGRFIKRASGACTLWLGDWINYGETKWGEKYNKALANTELEYGTLANAAYVSKNIPFSRRRENLSFSHHQEVASLEPKEQDKYLKIAEEKELTRSELRTLIKESHKKEIKTIPEGQFNVIYADPPWCYGDKQNTEILGGAEKHYPTMTIEELCQIKLPVADNAILFLWVTSPLLDECWPVIKAWGFEYKTSFVWDKVKHNMGHYNSVRHEFLLVCTRGSFTPEVPTLFDSVITEERSDIHSQKPIKFYEIIETLYPNGTYLELFSRNKREKWTMWGDE